MKKRTKVLAVCAAAFASIALLAGCSSQPAQTNAGDAKDQSLQPVSLVYLNKADYEPIMIADHEGFFKECAAEVNLITVSGSGQQSVEALLAGSADIAASGQGPVADAIGKYGDDIVVLCGANCSTGGQVVVAGPAMTGAAAITPYDKGAANEAAVADSFESAAASLGHPVRLGVQQGATTESALKSWLSKMGVSYNDFDADDASKAVSLVNVKANTLPTVLATGNDIEMMAASQPFPNTALSTIPGSYKVGSNADTDSYDVQCYTTTKKVFEEKEDSIKAVIEALNKATNFMADPANHDACVKTVSETIGSDTATVEAAFAAADWKTTMSDKMIQSIAKTAKKKGYEITPEQVKAACPLIDWLDGLN